MNRRRFLSMLGMLPAALALPKVEPARKVTITVSSLIGESGPELIIPPNRWTTKGGQ